MFDLHCETCDRTYLMGARSLRSLENTAAGPVGDAVCPHGHQTRVEFRRRRAERVERPGPVPAREGQARLAV